MIYNHYDKDKQIYDSVYLRSDCINHYNCDKKDNLYVSYDFIINLVIDKILFMFHTETVIFKSFMGYLDAEKKRPKKRLKID